VTNIDSAKSHVEDGVKHLRAADKHQKDAGCLLQ